VFPVRYGLDLYILFRALHSPHTVYLCVPYGSHKKQRLFPQTALTGWAIGLAWVIRGGGAEIFEKVP
jgi:hypothetical protein